MCEFEPSPEVYLLVGTSPMPYIGSSKVPSESMNHKTTVSLSVCVSKSKMALEQTTSQFQMYTLKI